MIPFEYFALGLFLAGDFGLLLGYVFGWRAHERHAHDIDMSQVGKLRSWNDE